MRGEEKEDWWQKLNASSKHISQSFPRNFTTKVVCAFVFSPW
jgi:hypothetical protein